MRSTSSAHAMSAWAVMALLFLLVPGAVLGLAAPSTAQQAAEGEFSLEFDRPGVRGRVFGLGTWGERLVVGGLELASDGAELTHIAAFDGALWSPLGGGILGDVRDVTTFEGDLVAAGWFSHAGGSQPGDPPFVEVGGVARWDGTSWSSFGPGLDLSFALEPRVFALEVYQGELYAGGWFDLSGGQAVDSLARWDGSAWQPVGGPFTGFEHKVLDLHATADGRLVVTGEFQSVDGTPALNVAVWDGSTWSNLGGGLGTTFSSVFAVEEFGGDLHFTGNFRTAGGPGGIDAQKIARWDGNAWHALGGGLPDWDISVTGYALEAFGGALYVGGNFIEVDGLGGVLSRAVARWDGGQWSSVGGVFGADLATTAIVMTLWNDQLVIGGEFEMGGNGLVPGETVCSESVIAYDGVSTWTALGEGLGFGDGTSKLMFWEGELYSFGAFRTAGDVYAPNMARFTGSGWEHVASLNPGGKIEDAVIFEGDLVITGNFTQVDGLPISGTARLDADSGTWSSMTGGGGTALEVFDGDLYGGGLGSPRRWNGSGWETFGDGIFGQVYDLHAHDGVLYIGGSLNAFIEPGPDLIGWDGTDMFSVGGGTDGTVHVMASWQGDLVVGGEFDSAGGVSARRLVRWDGSQFHPFGDGQTLTGFAVQELATFQGDLYVGGDLVSGQSPMDWIAVWSDAEGFQPLGETTLNSSVFTLAPDEAGGVLWMGGGWFELGDAPLGGVTTWTPAGNGPSDFTDLGGGSPGRFGVPELGATGTLEPDSPLGLTLAPVPPGGPTLLWIALTSSPLPVFGGTQHAVPHAGELLLFSSPAGSLDIAATWPAGVPAATEIWLQFFVADATVPDGVILSDAVRGTTP